MNGFSAQSRGFVDSVKSTAQSIADNVMGNGNSSTNNNPHSATDSFTLLKQLVTGINKLVARLAPDQRMARVPVSSLAVGKQLDTNNVAFSNVTYNSIIITCRGLGATIDVYINQATPTGFPDFQGIGGSGTTQFFFPSTPINQLVITNSGTAVANGNVDLIQY